MVDSGPRHTGSVLDLFVNEGAHTSLPGHFVFCVLAIVTRGPKVFTSSFYFRLLLFS